MIVRSWREFFTFFDSIVTGIDQTPCSARCRVQPVPASFDRTCLDFVKQPAEILWHNIRKPDIV